MEVSWSRFFLRLSNDDPKGHIKKVKQAKQRGKI